MSKDANTINLTALAQEWARRLQSCEYAGEVVVPQAELPAIAQKVRRDLFSDRRSAETRRCLLVLAINCMYYDHDEKGFWVHFCNLLNVEDNPQTQTWLGEMMEGVLLDLKLITETRYGPFRFVSPLREQCGITRREIPRFASLLNYLTERYGWDGIRVLDREVFNQNVSACVQGRHLSQFLLDDQGWLFTRDVARSISQFRRSVLDDQALSQLHGYRTGFFRDLFDALDREPGPDARHLTRPPLPRLVFFPDFRQIVIAFDQQSVNTGCYRMDGENVRRNLIPMDKAEMFDENIQGQRLNSDKVWESWSLKGWIPTDSPIGLFHVDRGYVDHREGVTPGKYYMVGSYKKPPPKDVELSSYGAVDLPFDELEYDAWLVEITKSTDLKFLGVNEKPLDRLTTLIAWADESNRLPGTYDLEKAFVGKLPPITILRPELFSSNAVGLFVDDGSGTRRLRPSNISAGQAHIEVETKSRGRVWVEPISRMREFAGLDTLGELAFCLLPECWINWPNRLYGPSEQPEVELVAKDKAISLEIQDAEPIDNNKWRWKIKSSVAVLQGYLRSGGCEIPLARRVFRADIRKKTEASTRFLLSSEFQHPISLVACGIPGARAELRLTDGQQTKRLGELGVFNEGGEISFSTLAIRDALAGYREPVGQFVVMDAELEVRTNTLFVNGEAVREWISNPISTTDVKWWPLLPVPIAEVLATALQIRDASPSQIAMPGNMESVPEVFSQLFGSLRRLCFVFDRAEFPDRPDVSEDQVILECHGENRDLGVVASWFVQARKVFEAGRIAEGSNTETLLAEYSILSWRPPFQRWREKIEEIARHLRIDVEALPLVEEWKKDVEKGYLSSYKSRIASQAGGRELTQAWVSYNEGNLSAAVASTSPLLDGRTSSPIADLAAILVRLCWFRMAYCRSQPPLHYQSSNKKLGLCHKELTEIIRFADWSGDESRAPRTANLAMLAAVLPITEPDRAVLLIFGGTGQKEHTNSEKDWLICYCKLLVSRALKNDGDAKQMAQRLQGVTKDIPASPDKRLIIELMEKYL